MKNKIILIVVMLLCTYSTFAGTGKRMMISLYDAAKFDNKTSSTTVGIKAIDDVARNFGCTHVHTIRKGKVYVLELDSNTDMREAVKAFLDTKLCRYAEGDNGATTGDWKVTATAPNDTVFNRQWGLYNDGSFTVATAKAGADIDLLSAWDIEDGDSNIIVAVIDAGVKSNHPDMVGRLWRNKAEIPGNGIDDDTNGYIDDTLGWNIVSDTNDIEDDNGHGTHVAGIIGADVNNTTGIAGVDKHCKLMILKTADNTGFFAYSWMTEAIYYAADNGARVINISAGGLSPSNIVKDALDYAISKKVTVVAAMMNSGLQQKFYPAAYPGVIAVGATDPEDKIAYFSCQGDHISVCAPGHHIFSLSHLYDTAMVVMSGTSQATPHVAGVAALLLAQDSTRTAAQIKTLIETSAEDVIGDSKDLPGWDKYYGNGRLNAFRALTNAGAGITKVADNAGVIIYPNPVKDKLYLDYKGRNKYHSASLYSPAGSLINTFDVSKNQNSVDLGKIPCGIYYMVLYNNQTGTRHMAIIHRE